MTAVAIRSSVRTTKTEPARIAARTCAGGRSRPGRCPRLRQEARAQTARPGRPSRRQRKSTREQRPFSSAISAASIWDEISVKVGERLCGVHAANLPQPLSLLDSGVRAVSAILGKFLADRGTHLAAMIAYFALLAFVPLLFLALSLVALDRRAGRVELPDRAAPARFPRELGRPSPLRRRLRSRRAPALSAHRSSRPALERARVLQRARVRVQHRLRAPEPALHPPEAPRPPSDRRGARGALRRARDRLGRCRARQGHARTWRRVLAYVYGLARLDALAARVRVEPLPAPHEPSASPGGRPCPVRSSPRSSCRRAFRSCRSSCALRRELVALQAYGGLVLLLVWLYVMANILVLGAEVNWWLAARARGPTSRRRARLAPARKPPRSSRRSRTRFSSASSTFCLDVRLVVDARSGTPGS